jgi:hypothetical protein
MTLKPKTITTPYPELGSTHWHQIAKTWTSELSHLTTWHHAPCALDELTHATRQALYLIDRKPEHKYVGPCLTCENDLHAMPGKETIRCPKCHQTTTLTTLKNHTLEKAGERLWPLDEAIWIFLYAGFLINPSTIHTWQARGQLADHGKTRIGSKTQRLYDLQEIWNQWARHAEEGNA